MKELQSRATLLRAFYYTAIIEDQECSSIRSLIDWLERLHRRHQGDPRISSTPGRRKVEGNMDTSLRSMPWSSPSTSTKWCCSRTTRLPLPGRGCAAPRRAVTVISTIASQPPMIVGELRRQADVFTDLVELQPKLGGDRPSAPPRAIVKRLDHAEIPARAEGRRPSRQNAKAAHASTNFGRRVQPTSSRPRRRRRAESNS
ncbi:hypothetical protein ABIB81_006074 [Bradyrhizobium sp. I1.7.5]